MRLVDIEGDHWIPVASGWQCEEFPGAIAPDRAQLEEAWGPLQEKEED